MPLPLANLDTRRWADLAAEARALLPQFAPEWTDHNLHDPGIMLVELLAWLTEQDMYRANRVPARHRRKFLSLLGYLPRPTQPARTHLRFTVGPAASPLELPAGTVFSAGGTAGDEGALLFRTIDPITVVPRGRLTVQSFDGVGFTDLTGSVADRAPLPVWGTDPAAAGSAGRDPALYLGFELPPPASTPMRLWLDVPARPGERENLPAAARDRHHSVRTSWELWDGTSWRELDPVHGEVSDATRGLTLPGPVVLTPPVAVVPAALGTAPAAAHYVRCRLAAGRPDRAPELLGIVADGVAAEQAGPVRTTLTVAPGVVVPAPGPVPRSLVLTIGPGDVVTEIVVDPASAVPPVLVLARTPTTVTLTLTLLGRGSGEPGQRLRLPRAAVAGDSLRLWTSAGGAVEVWRQRPDLDGSARTDADFVLGCEPPEVRFGDGERGAVVAPGAAIFAWYDVTAGAAGNVPAGRKWALGGADDEVNRMLLGVDPSQIVVTIDNSAPATGGAAAETTDHVAGRAAQTLWAHERITELGPPDGTLDQVERTEVLARAAPERATTRLDIERLALEVPGTAVARARAWAELDVRYPCLVAPGTVTVVVVPSLPANEPRPTPGLLAMVRRHLGERRVIGTRLLVAGPGYLRVAVTARVTPGTGSDPVRVRQDVVRALDRFLDPLAGGPAGKGWPFGRDVYRTEVLQTITAVPGVVHIRDLALRAGDQDAGCENVCVPATWLVAPGVHTIEMR